MILALGARGREFDARITPFLFFHSRKVRGPGIEPGSTAWKVTVFLTTQKTTPTRFELARAEPSRSTSLTTRTRCLLVVKKLTPEGIEPPIFGSGIRQPSGKKMKIKEPM